MGSYRVVPAWPRVCAAGCLAAVVLALSGCGGTSTTTTTNSVGQTVVTCHTTLAKTKFVLHVGIALAAFDRWIYKPYRAGSFKSGAPGRTKALAKAGATSLVVLHELKIALGDARCDGPTLKKLVSPVSAAAAGIASLKGDIGAGNLGAIDSAKTLVQTLISAAGTYGIALG